MPHSIQGARAGVLAAAVAVLALFAGLLLGGGTPRASAQEPTPEQARDYVDVEINVERFAVEQGEVVARGPARAVLTQRDGTVTTLDDRVALQVDTANNCRVLELHLAELYLDLLGLQVRTSTINLKLTGSRKEALGKLFCKLSEGLKLPGLAKAQRAARSLNANLEGRPLQLLRFRAHLPRQTQEPAPQPERQTRQGQAPPPPADACPVLDLLLGPLDLDLLGLVVELYGATETDPIRVNVVADPNGGQLGRTFCQISQ